MNVSSEDVEGALRQMTERVDALISEVQKLQVVVAKSARATITDGLAIGFGIALLAPIAAVIVFVVIAILGALGIALHQ